MAITATESQWDEFYPMSQLLMRPKHTIPWCKSYKHDEKLNGVWVKWDPTFKNTVSDPRDLIRNRSVTDKG